MPVIELRPVIHITLNAIEAFTLYETLGKLVGGTSQASILGPVYAALHDLQLLPVAVSESKYLEWAVMSTKARESEQL